MTRLCIAAAVLLLVAGCLPRHFKGDDAEMMRAAKIVADAVNNYHSDTSEWPESLDEAKPYIAPSTPWPTNPYDGKPIADTGSSQFDPTTSVGMVYYEKIYRDDRMVNYQLHVFGRRGKLYIIGNTALGVKE